MGLFSKRARPAVEPEPEDTALQRRVLIAQQQTKLQRAQQLKSRSSAVAAELSAEGRVNNYAWRIRQSALNSLSDKRGTADAH